MPSGSKWSKSNGFELISHDYSLINNHIKEAIDLNQNKIEKSLIKDSKTFFNKKAFLRYFKKFLESTTFPFLCNFKFGFFIHELRSNKYFLCIVDGIKKSPKVFDINNESEIYKYNLSFVIRTSTNIFNDCNNKIMHNTFGASKLLEIILMDKNAERNLGKYFALVDFYENDCLPVSRLFTLRNIFIIFRRWREFLDILYYFYVMKIKKGKISDLYSSV